MRRAAILLVLLLGAASAASADTLLMPPRDMLVGNAAAPNGPGSSGEVVWGVTKLANHTAAAPTTYSINFGDGSPNATGNVTDRSYIAVNHVFTNTGTLTITLQVTRGSAIEIATTTVRVFDGLLLTAEDQRGVNVNRAIENGLRFLWVGQTSRAANFPDGIFTDWGVYTAPHTALITLAFENHGYHLPNDNSAPTGIYEKYIVRRGLNYVIDQLNQRTLTVQPAGDPCVNVADGPAPCIGLGSNAYQEGYATSLAILPLAGSNALSRTVSEITGSASGGYVVGKTYGEVLQRLVNTMAWGQGDGPGFNAGRGGWYYSFNAGGTDGSTIGWNVLALLDAAAAGITIPPFVKTEFKNYAIPLGLNMVPAGPNNLDGTFDYSADNNPASAAGGTGGPNMAKNGIGVQAMFYADIIGLGDTQVARARNSISHRWYNPVSGDTYPCGTGHNKGCAYAMFNVFKALKLQGITTLPDVTRPAGPGTIPAGDWYADYVDWLLDNQTDPATLATNSGSWSGGPGNTAISFSGSDNSSNFANAAMAELILSPVALIAPDPSLFSTVGLGPATALLTPFGTHTIIATATSSGGAPVAGATVNFSVLTGPNAGRTGQSVTNQNGQASFTYTDTGGPGRDTAQAFIGTLGSNVVEALWTVPACNPQTLSVQLSSPIYPLDNGWRGVTINGAPGAKVTQVCQDETPNFENIPAWAIDADGVGSSNVSIRAQRSGTRTAPGNGRVYTIYFTAAACTGSVTVAVPTAAVGGMAVNDGARYNSVTGGSCAVPAVPSIGPVPNVVGRTQAGASSDLAAAGLTLGAVAQLNSPTVPYGQVMSQNPGAGTPVALGSAVAVTISSGPASVAAPNVVGQSQGNAVSAITGAGLTPNVTQASDNIVPAGIVSSQSPAAGTQLPPGTPVMFIVSTGKATSIVPNVVGLTLAGAVSAVGGAGLNFGNVSLVYNASISDGMVFTQSPAPGTVLPPGSPVDFEVSLGPQPVEVPNLTGQTEAAATSSLATAGLSVGNVTQVNDAVVPAGKVANQTPAGGSFVPPGSSINFSVSMGPVMVTVPDVTTMAQAAAQTAITGSGLAVGTISHANHPAVAPGAVILQSPAGGESAPLGSAVALTISLGPTPVLVPNLTGQTQVLATGNIIAAALSPGTVTTANSPSVPAGNVMGQNPLGGQTVLPGTPVNIVVSLGPVIVTVPNVVGQLQAPAQSAISTIGLFLQSISFTTNGAPAGQVIAQSPAGGASAVLGSPMTITVSLGSNSVTVPNVIGKTQANAGLTLAGSGLNVGIVTTTSHPTIPAGTVIDQSPAGSTVAGQGSAVNLLVSVGAVSATVPNVVGSSQDAAVATILAAHLGAHITFGTSPVVTAGNVISQQPAAGTSLGEGANVTIKVSTGLSAATVPNVLGETQAAAQTDLNAGLVLGTVTQQSSVKPAGQVVGQTPSAGASAPGGTSVNLVLSTGPVAGEPAILETSLSSQVLSAGNGASITSKVLDGFTVPVLPAPGVTYQVIAGPGATGTMPYVNGDQLLSSADTRGPYTLHGVVGSTVVSDDVKFSVFDGAAKATNAAKFVKLATAEQTVSAKVDALLQAYQNLAPAGDVTNAKNAMTAALLTVPITGPNAMTRSTAVALENGFLPSMGQLAAGGFPLTAQDVAFGNLIDQLADKLKEIKEFYAGLNPDALSGAGNAVQQLSALNDDLQALQSQLAALTPTPAGIVQYAPQLNRLLGDTFPEHLHAVTNRVVSIASLYPNPTNLPGGVARLQNATDFFAELNARRQLSTPGAFYGTTQPAFFGLLGLMSGCSLQMKLVNEIYGPIMTEVSEMIAVLALNGLITNYANTAHLGDLISGASLSFMAPGLGGSTIEGYGFDATSAGGNETWFIGPEAFDLVKNLIQSFKPSDIHSPQDVWDYFKGIADAVNASFDGYERAHTQPDEVFQGLCLLDDSFGCTSLWFDNGFPDVNSTRFPSPVIVILNNKNNGSWSSGIFNFVP